MRADPVVGEIEKLASSLLVREAKISTGFTFVVDAAAK